ncbi:5-(carboxyamino)imidazole ribonucleotide synthase [Candidatus Caldatribacterium sp. SIUC1]|uniref:5-(carboxyamino)imidazole ribonucleotide synthase n=1 Tax=Candidatus Caldatribacterium sp. SIUC1 TaxID=3418365 RepID=UPI003F68BDEC
MQARRFPFFRIGIIGGGQLGKMMVQEAKKMGFFVTVLDPTPASPAGQIADLEITAGFYDEEGLRKLLATSDVVTYDIEHVNTAFLKACPEKDKIRPAPELLEIIQDKLRQREVLKRGGIPVPRFAPLEEDTPEAFRSFGFPLVQKARRGGYDGRGVAILRGEEDLPKRLRGPSYLEEYVPVDRELAVLVARSTTGEIRTYPVVEMVFKERAHICDLALAPARIPEEVAEQAEELGRKCVELLEGVGIFAVEMFLTESGELLVNEIAPRPHNSGHFTIEACATSQFEEHLRAILGLPLGSTRLLSPAVMVNLLGEEGESGTPLVEGLDEALAVDGVFFHFYGKRETRPFRKMGHVTVLGETLKEALEKALRVKNILKVRGERKDHEGTKGRHHHGERLRPSGYGGSGQNP